MIKQTKIKLNPKTFIDYSQEIDNVYENKEDKKEKKSVNSV